MEDALEQKIDKEIQKELERETNTGGKSWEGNTKKNGGNTGEHSTILLSQEFNFKFLDST